MSDRDLCQCGHKRENHGGILPSCNEPGCECRAFRDRTEVASLACCVCGGFLAREYDAGDACHSVPGQCVAELREQLADVRERAQIEDEKLGECLRDETRHRLALGVEALRRLEALENGAKAERGARRALEARLESDEASWARTLETIRLRFVGFEGRFDALRRSLGELESRQREAEAQPVDEGHATARLFALDGKGPVGTFGPITGKSVTVGVGVVPEEVLEREEQLTCGHLTWDSATTCGVCRNPRGHAPPHDHHFEHDESCACQGCQPDELPEPGRQRGEEPDHWPNCGGRSGPCCHCGLEGGCGCPGHKPCS